MDGIVNNIFRNKNRKLKVKSSNVKIINQVFCKLKHEIIK